MRSRIYYVADIVTASQYVGGGQTKNSTSTYDANWNLQTKSEWRHQDGIAAIASYSYNSFNQLTGQTINGQSCTYAYNAEGIRTAKAVGTTVTSFYLDSGNVVGEKTGTGSTTYLRGSSLISGTSGSTTQYYLHNAHGDVVNLTDPAGTSTKAYAYDAFGNEKNQVASDATPFRYCGEYLNRETNEYYLRARYYDSSLGRFSQADTHWNPGNMIYGDIPQKIGEYRDALGLSRYVYAPQRTAGPQAGNLYIYCINSPVIYVDTTGKVMTYRNLCLEGGPSGGGADVSLSPADTVFSVGTIVSIAVVGQVLLAQSDGQDQTQESAITQSTTASPMPPNNKNDKDNKNTESKLRTFSRRNFRYNLQILTRTSGKGLQTHHVFPIALAERFAQIGINVHDPILGTWVDISHQKWSRAYEIAWTLFFEHIPNPTIEQVLQKAAELSEQFGFSILF